MSLLVFSQRRVSVRGEALQLDARLLYMQTVWN